MTMYLIAYAAGIVAFVEIAVPLIARARKRPPGRHRAECRRMSWADEIALRASNEVSRIRKYRFRELVAEQRYAHKAGVGRYAHLRPDELTETAEHRMRVAEFKEARRAQVVDLAALRVRGAVPTVAEVDDEWWAGVSA